MLLRFSSMEECNQSHSEEFINNGIVLESDLEELDLEEKASQLQTVDSKLIHRTHHSICQKFKINYYILFSNWEHKDLNDDLK